MRWTRRRWLARWLRVVGTVGSAEVAHCSALVLRQALPRTLPLALPPVLPLAWPVPAVGAPAPGTPRVVLIVGDSLSAEYGIPRGRGWVALLDQRVQREKLAATIINASISGETSSGGRSRLAALLKLHQPAVVVIELGGNDALRGLPLAMTQANLTEMTRAAKAAGARVVVVGMQVPPNYGRKYGDDFFALFASVARAQSVSLVPFLLAGVADSPEAESLFQPDRIHPKAEAHPKMLDNVWPVLRPLLLK